MINNQIINACRKANIFKLMLATEPENWEQCGDYLNSKTTSLVIKKNGTCFYNDTNNSFSHNAIDILCRYKNLSFADALAFIKANTKIDYPTDEEVIYDFLCNDRGISKETVTQLLLNKLVKVLHQNGYINIAFCNSNKDIEILGITTHDFKSRRNGKSYWSFGNSTPNKIFITEGAVDCISLYELKQDPDALFISLGGESNKVNLVSDIIARYNNIPIFLAVDNDAEGNLIFKKALNAHPNIKRIIPQFKDWNEVLISLKKTAKVA